MAKERVFSNVDKVHGIIKSVGKVYKDKAPKNATSPHIVVGSMQPVHGVVDYSNVNIQIFVKKTDSGMPDRPTLKPIIDKILEKLNEYTDNGQDDYFEFEITLTAFIPDAKTDYDGYVIRLEILTA